LAGTWQDRDSACELPPLFTAICTGKREKDEKVAGFDGCRGIKYFFFVPLRLFCNLMKIKKKSRVFLLRRRKIHRHGLQITNVCRISETSLHLLRCNRRNGQVMYMILLVFYVRDFHFVILLQMLKMWIIHIHWTCCKKLLIMKYSFPLWISVLGEQILVWICSSLRSENCDRRWQRIIIIILKWMHLHSPLSFFTRKEEFLLRISKFS